MVLVSEVYGAETSVALDNKKDCTCVSVVYSCIYKDHDTTYHYMVSKTGVLARGTTCASRFWVKTAAYSYTAHLFTMSIRCVVYSAH